MNNDNLYSKQFSERTNWFREQNSVILLLNRLKGEGRSLIDLTESNPTQCSFTAHNQEIVSALEDPGNLLYQPDSKGKREVREAIAGYYNAANNQLTSDRIFLTASTSEAYTYLFRLLTNAGDRILFPSPSYPLFSFLTDLNDIEMDAYRLAFDGKWSIDFDHLENLVTSQTKAIVLVNPNNPTGTYVSKEELHYINKICSRHNLSIICDEVFFDFSFEERNISESLIANKENLTFVMNGCSKLLGLPQMKLSWIAMNGPEALIDEAAGRLDIIADTYLSVNAPAQNAFLQWFGLKDDIQNEIRERVIHNRELLRDLIKGVSGIKLLESEGGWYAVIAIASLKDEEEFVLKLLKEDHVFVHPGYFYDFERQGCFILSLLPQKDIFGEGIKRIIKRFLMI